MATHSSSDEKFTSIKTDKWLMLSRRSTFSIIVEISDMVIDGNSSKQAFLRLDQVILEETVDVSVLNVDVQVM